MFLSWYFAGKVELQSVKVSRARTIAEGKEMLKMGFAISITGLFVLASSYIVRVYINRIGCAYGYGYRTGYGYGPCSGTGYYSDDDEPPLAWKEKNKRLF